MEGLRYEYRLQLDFSQPAWNHRFFLRGFPQSDSRQQILDQQIAVSPHRFLIRSRDSFGNLCFYGSAEERQERFQVLVTGTARVGPEYSVPEEDPCRWIGMKYPSHFTRPGPRLEALAWQLAPRTGSASPLERAMTLMDGVYSALSYQQWVTGVQTTAEAALEKGAGVCQDYAHVLLALCRMEQIPARYVVGLLMGEGASHAWVEVLDGGRWYGLDPTNRLLAEGQHIKVAVGRDAGDCPLNRGTFLGGGFQTQQVSVLVTPCTLSH